MSISSLRSSFAVLLLVSFPTAQLDTITNKTLYRPGDPIAVSQAYTNATLQPFEVKAHPVVSGVQQTSRIRFQLRPVNLERPATHLDPPVRLNGVPYELRYLDFLRQDTSTFLGQTLGPGTTRGLLGGSAGWGEPVNLLSGLGPTSGGDITLHTANSGSFLLTPTDHVELSPGLYRITTLITNIEIAGFVYTPSTTGYLSDTQLITVEVAADDE